ncbi:MAG: hypothetical protein A2100_03515 [Sideroxydans sp. GWF2_59_14]|nr:MAG: hypothetical protein A2100_03515 [Sideroxydans sp. GWF2_59_14]HAF45803.1 hypothetical protein [Gallionellaceae bacterium]
MSTSTIEHLNASQLARHAFNVFLFSGRHQTGARLIYRALELQPHNAEALRCLSDLLDSNGTEVFSGVVLEYALSEEPQFSVEERQTLDDLRFLAKWSWGFSSHTSGNPHLAQDAFADRSAFLVDDSRYQQFLDQILTRTGSLEGGFKAAHTLCGAMAGFLQHGELGGKAGVVESLHPEQFQKTEVYSQWLQSPTDELDALEKARLEKSKPTLKPRWKFWQ